MLAGQVQLASSQLILYLEGLIREHRADDGVPRPDAKEGIEHVAWVDLPRALKRIGRPRVRAVLETLTGIKRAENGQTVEEIIKGKAPEQAAAIIARLAERRGQGGDFDEAHVVRHGPGPVAALASGVVGTVGVGLVPHLPPERPAPVPLRQRPRAGLERSGERRELLQP